MKIAVTISGCGQVAMDVYRNWHKTRVFDSTASIDDMMAWARTIDKDIKFSDLLFSEVDEKVSQLKE